MLTYDEAMNYADHWLAGDEGAELAEYIRSINAQIRRNTMTNYDTLKRDLENLLVEWEAKLRDMDAQSEEEYTLMECIDELKQVIESQEEQDHE